MIIKYANDPTRTVACTVDVSYHKATHENSLQTREAAGGFSIKEMKNQQPVATVPL